MEDLRRRIPDKKEPESRPDSESDHVSSHVLDYYNNEQC